VNKLIVLLLIASLSGCATLKQQREQFVIDCINKGGTVFFFKHTRKCIVKEEKSE
jgi:hypothetical protein